MKILLSEIDLPEKDLRASIDEDALDELAASMRDRGQKQAICVRSKLDGRYEVVFGSRRFRAATINGWLEINAEIAEDSSDANTAADKLIENVQRQNLTPIEEAYGLLELIGEGVVDVRSLKRQTGKSKEWIRTRLDLADLPEDIQGAIHAGVIGVGVAKALGSIQNPTIREQYVSAAVENGCTTTQATVWASQARFAESGQMTMDEITSRQNDITAEPHVIDQQYHCFICSEIYSWRRINTLVVCGDCQEAIGTSRQTVQTDLLHIPLDNDETPA